jgi:hypothetical protein
MNSPTTPTIGFELKEKVASLEAAILDKHPRMPTLLQEIWKTLKQYPENVTLMNEEEIATVVRGLERQTGVFLAESVTAGSKKARTTETLKAKIAKLGEDAF